jgi:hypothetical protein
LWPRECGPSSVGSASSGSGATHSTQSCASPRPASPSSTAWRTDQSMITLGSTQTAVASHAELARAGPSLPERERSTRSARAHEPSQRITEQPRQLLEPRGDSGVHLAGSRPPTKRGRAHRGLDVVVVEAGRCAARGGWRASRPAASPQVRPTPNDEITGNAPSSDKSVPWLLTATPD